LRILAWDFVLHKSDIAKKHTRLEKSLKRKYFEGYEGVIIQPWERMVPPIFD